MKPGKPPYRRGIHADMYRGRPWTIRQLSGAGSPKQVNARIRFLLANGATGINLLFDVPTIQMYDSDEPESAGMVGVVGVPIDTVEDMDAVFDGIPLDKYSVSLVTHYPSNTAILMAMYLVMAQRRGIPWANLRGSVQNDVVMEEVVRAGPAFIPPAACFMVQEHNIEFLVDNVPKWNAATFNGYNLREFGAGMALETAVALQNAYEMSGIPGALDRLAFFWCIGNDFFREVARLRAARQVWWGMTGGKLRCHCQTSGLSLTRAEPFNNIVRAGYQAMAAVLGGCQSLHVDSYDEAYAVPSQAAALVSLRTQQILQVETGVMDEPDPLGGSEYVERLTDEMALAIRGRIDEIRHLGSTVGIIESGWLRAECMKGQHVSQVYVDSEAGITLPAEPMPSVSKSVQRRVSIPTLNDGNIMEQCIVAARNGATVGQLRQAFLEKYGRWQRA